jgi:hypothetical protein
LIFIPAFVDSLLVEIAETKKMPDCPFERGVLSRGCLGEPVIKGIARLTALAKPCSLRGRDSGFIGSRAKQTEARIASIEIL